MSFQYYRVDFYATAISEQTTHPPTQKFFIFFSFDMLSLLQKYRNHEAWKKLTIKIEEAVFTSYAIMLSHPHILFYLGTLNQKRMTSQQTKVQSIAHLGGRKCIGKICSK